MKDSLPLWVIAIIALLFVGGFSWEAIRPKDKTSNTVQVETLRVTEWAYVTQWQTKLVKRTDTLRIPFAITDSVLCCEQLTDCADQLWSLANFEAEAEQALEGGGMARVGFSMPLYRESPERAFMLQVTRPDTVSTNTVTIYAERKWYHRIGISAGVGYGVGPLGAGPSANIQAGYTLFELSDIWR